MLFAPCGMAMVGDEDMHKSMFSSCIGDICAWMWKIGNDISYIYPYKNKDKMVYF